jgi:hypothetical protein
VERRNQTANRMVVLLLLTKPVTIITILLDGAPALKYSQKFITRKQTREHTTIICNAEKSFPIFWNPQITWAILRGLTILFTALTNFGYLHYKKKNKSLAYVSYLQIFWFSY